MSIQYPATHSQILYQADQNLLNTIRSIRDRIHSICSTHVNRLVRIQTLDGRVVEGVIVSCDHGHLYLRVSHPDAHRAFTPYAAESILTLVLYELLVIVLLA
jgi:hypothetical protein